MQQGMNTLEIDRMAPQAQGIETLGSMEEVPMVPEGGIQAAVPDATRMLADAGRHGDIYVVHASEGETVVPKEVLEGPGGQQIRESLFRQMGQLGVDPERYVVGNELNSINPETGLPEFFFKKAFKSIKKIFKKVAPIILPIVLTPFIGPIAAGAVGSGIGTLIQGGSAKDALKAAAFGGITAGVMSGISGMAGMSGPGVPKTFWGGFEAGLPSAFTSSGPSGVIPFTGGPDQAAKQSVWFSSTPGDGPVSPGIFEPNWDRSIFSSGQSPNVQATSAPKTQAYLHARSEPLLEAVKAPPTGTLVSTPGGPDLRIGGGWPQIDNAVLSPANTGASSGPLSRLTPTQKIIKTYGDTATNLPKEGYLDTASRHIFGTPEPVAAATKSDAAFRLEVFKAKSAGLPVSEQLARGEAARARVLKDLQPGPLRKWGIPALGAVALASATGLTDAEETPFQSQARKIDPSLVRQARLFNDGITRPRKQAPIQFSFLPDQVQFSPNQVQVPSLAAHGGEMQRDFPRRNGAISGPGTGTSDDVPAMLSDGEFVMTAQAVRGAGNGSRRQGVENLYNLMRNFEATV